MGIGETRCRSKESFYYVGVKGMKEEKGLPEGIICISPGGMSNERMDSVT